MRVLVRKTAAVVAGAAFATFSLSTLVSPSSAQDEAVRTKSSRGKTAKKVDAPSLAVDDVDSESGDEAQERSKSSTKTRTKTEPFRRVPTYFGGLGLSSEQRDAIYDIEAKYQAQLQELQKQTERLHESRIIECEDVLTAPQKKALAEARKSAADRRKSNTDRRKAEAAAELDEDDVEESGKAQTRTNRKLNFE